MKSTNPNCNCNGDTVAKIVFVLLFLQIFVLGNINCHAQNRGFPGSPHMRIRTDLMRPFEGNVVYDPAKLKLRHKSSLSGTCYLNESWMKSDIYMIIDSAIVKGLETRIDLSRNELEIKYKGEIKVLPSYQINRLIINDNGELFVTENILQTSEKGFYKVLIDDENSLLCKFETKIKPSTYNIQLDAGNKSDKIIKEKYYFLRNEGKLIKLERSKSKLKKQFINQTEIYNFVCENKINPKKEESLILLIEFMNKNHLKLI